MNDTFRILVENTVVGMYIIKNSKFVYINEKFSEISAYSLEELMNIDFKDLIHKDDKKIVLEHFSDKSKLSSECSFRAMTKNKSIKHIRVHHSVKIINEERLIIGTVFDETQEMASKKELQKLANYDSLTKLFNRNYFDIEFEHAIDLAKRNKNKLALVLFDIDNFKRINDSLGHKAGDKILQETAKRIKNILRKSDVFSRIGGDEFTIIIENYKSADELVVLLNKLKIEMQQNIEVEGVSFHVSLSIGVSLFPENGEDALVLLKTADKAMYEAKKRGKNRFVFFNKSSDENSKSLELERELYKAFKSREFQIYLQPQVAIKSKKMIGAEALIRWEHPTKGVISPIVFLELASDIGLLPELDFYMIESIFNLLEKYRKDGSLNFKISVNISNSLFQHQKFLPKMQSLKLKYGLLTNFIQLELTENILMHNVKHSYSLVKILKFLGYKLSIDDFGTGYSSLSHIKMLEINELKIDKSFVENITTSKNDKAIIKAIIDICKTLEMEIVAEGVQNQAQLKVLDELGCDTIQGYYFSQVLPLEEFEEKWLNPTKE